eukprot:682967-Alexandrium_andersonii.AAC.1
MDGAALWLRDKQQRLGARPANAGERARAMGIGQYAKDLGLKERRLADAIGNSFDEDLVGQRLEAGLITLLKSPHDACHGARQPGRVADPAQAAAEWY